MGDVINILEKQPHLEGAAICIACKHEWVAVAPIGTMTLECPNCALLKGVFNASCAPDVLLECECGCRHFFIGENYPVCCLCGLSHNWY